MQTYNVVDLFAGAGGLSLGFLQTGNNGHTSYYRGVAIFFIL